ncbi:putative glutamate-tRNA ligase cytoplasmic-like, partial [Trifolium medium]|nr:putative glutamate-tRNA ligase cytoplasmic-like [Trifolium medium]
KKGGSGEPSASKSKDQTVVTDKVKNVNGDVSENIKGGGNPLVQKKGGGNPLAEIDLPDAEIGKVRLRFAPEP